MWVLLRKIQERHDHNFQDFSRNHQKLHLVTQEDQEFIQMDFGTMQSMNEVE